MSQHGNSPFNPVILLVCWLHIEIDVKYEISWVSIGAEGASPLTCFVNGTRVSVQFFAFEEFLRQGLEVDWGSLVVKHFGLLFVQTVDFTVPPATLQVKPVGVTPVFRLHWNIQLTPINHLEIKCQSVNRQFVLFILHLLFASSSAKLPWRNSGWSKSLKPRSLRVVLGRSSFEWSWASGWSRWPRRPWVSNWGRTLCATVQALYCRKWHLTTFN